MAPNVARRPRAQLSLKLGVIVEEDTPRTLGTFNISRPSSRGSQRQGSQNPTKCTITLRNSKRSSKNEPQFLHTGRWPSVNMVDEVLHATADLVASGQYDLTGAATSEDVDMTGTKSSMQGRTDTFKDVTPDQLSMAMDFWNPRVNKDIFQTTAEMRANASLSSSSRQDTFSIVTAAHQSLFLQEIMEESSARAQTVEHLNELEDNDSAVEIVATLEGYRQTGWAEEMLKAFPRESYQFWRSSGLDPADYETEDLMCIDDHF